MTDPRDFVNWSWAVWARTYRGYGGSSPGTAGESRDTPGERKGYAASDLVLIFLKAAESPWEAAGKVVSRRDTMMLARHFSAGMGQYRRTSPVGTTD